MLLAPAGYNFTVTAGSLIQSASKGTPGFQVYLECEDGQIDFTIWLTEKNRENALAAFEALGVAAENLKSRTFLEIELPHVIVGREVFGQTKNEEYNGRTMVKVSRLGKKREIDAGKLADQAAGFFGAEPAKFVATDDDIPF